MNDRKERYLQRKAKQLKKLDSRIRELEIEARNANSEIKREIDTALNEAKEKRAAINDRMQALAETGSQAWKDIKRVISSSEREIERIVRRSLSQIKNA